MTPDIEALITQLVREAPTLDAAVVAELREALWSVGSPLALAIGRVVEYVGEGLVDPGIALPALAEACATLCAPYDELAVEAARYRVDTLVPTPDVPVGSLLRIR